MNVHRRHAQKERNEKRAPKKSAPKKSEDDMLQAGKKYMKKAKG